MPGRQGRVRREAGQPQHVRRRSRWWRPRASTTAWCRWARRAAPSRIRCGPCSCCSEGEIGQVYHARGCASAAASRSATRRTNPCPPGSTGTGSSARRRCKPYSKNKFALQLALVLGYRQRRHRQPGRARNGHLPVGPGPRRLAREVASTGGKFIWQDDQETPNTQQTTFEFGDAQITFDVRNLPTPPEGLVARCTAPTTSATSSSASRLHGGGSRRIPGLQEHGGNDQRRSGRGAGAGKAREVREDDGRESDRERRRRDRRRT